MISAELISYKITKLKITNNIPEDGTVELENIVGFDVKHKSGDRTAVAVMTESVKHRKNANLFSIELEVKGMFRLEGINSVESKKMHM